MILTTIALASMLASGPQTSSQSTALRHMTLKAPVHVIHSVQHKKHNVYQLAVDLHPMTEEEKHMFPGRENWDKTEWYESQFKSAKVVFTPEHVDEWHNGGIDVG